MKPTKMSFLKFLMPIVIFAASGCKKDPIGPVIQVDVTLATVYVGCSEVWLKMGFENNGEGGQYIITRDGNAVFKGWKNSRDTMVVDTTVQPGRSYAYQAYRLANNDPAGKSVALEVATLNTTSHNWSFQTYAFGVPSYGSSCLFDVAIADDGNIWTVGVIRTGSDTVYNAVHWDGLSWNIGRVPYSYQGHFTYSPVQCVFALDTDDIWFGGNGFERWDGMQFSNVEAPEPFWYGRLTEKIWMSSSDNIVTVGDKGTIVTYSNGTWQNPSSGTSYDLHDVWGGSINGRVFVSGYDSSGQHSSILSRDGTTWETIYTVDPWNSWWVGRKADSICGVVMSLWTSDGNDLWTGTTSGVYRSLFLDGKRYDGLSWKPDYIIGLPQKIRGQASNDVVVVGDFHTIAHWDGSVWTDFSQMFDTQNNSSLRSVFIKGNTLVAVGTYLGKAEIIVGRR